MKLYLCSVIVFVSSVALLVIVVDGIRHVDCIPAEGSFQKFHSAQHHAECARHCQIVAWSAGVAADEQLRFQDSLTEKEIECLSSDEKAKWIPNLTWAILRDRRENAR